MKRHAAACALAGFKAPVTLGTPTRPPGHFVHHSPSSPSLGQAGLPVGFSTTPFEDTFRQQVMQSLDHVKLSMNQIVEYLTILHADVGSLRSEMRTPCSPVPPWMCSQSGTAETGLPIPPPLPGAGVRSQHSMPL